MKSSLRELVHDYDPQLAVHPSACLPLSSHVLVADYNLQRLKTAPRTKFLCCESQTVPGAYDRILIEALDFEPIEQLKLDISTCVRLLEPTGSIFLIGRDRRRASRLAELMATFCVESERIPTKDGFVLLGHGASGTGYSVPARSVTLSLPRCRDAELATWPGLFSTDHIDTGTSLLIDSLPEISGRSLLDVGCGYGPLTVSAAMRGARVTYADVDCRAIRLTGENLSALGLTGHSWLTADLCEASDLFDLIVSYPPTHAGSEILQGLFRRMIRLLSTAGEMRLVLRSHLNYEKWLAALGTVTPLREDQGYKVLRVKQ